MYRIRRGDFSASARVLIVADNFYAVGYEQAEKWIAKIQFDWNFDAVLWTCKDSKRV